MAGTGKYGSTAKKTKIKEIYDPNVGFAYDPLIDVPSTKEAQKGAAEYYKKQQKRLFPPPTAGEDVYDEYAGPAYGPGGDVYLSPQEIKDQLKYGQYWPQGAIARLPGGRPMQFEFAEGAGIPGMGRGGRGGGGGLDAQDLAALRDRFEQLTLKMTGMTADQLGTNFQWYLPKWQGGWSQGDLERYYRGLPKFQETYPGIKEEMGVDDYNAIARRLNELSLNYRGGKTVTPDEVRRSIEEERAAI